MWLSDITTFFNASGHLPVKLPDYNNRLRVLVATYVTFSPDGTELLVNMGGEQVTLSVPMTFLRGVANVAIVLKYLLWFCFIGLSV